MIGIEYLNKNRYEIPNNIFFRFFFYQCITRYQKKNLENRNSRKKFYTELINLSISHMIFKYFTNVLILQKCYHVSFIIACLFIRYINYTKSSFHNYSQSPLEFRDSWLRDFSWHSTYKCSFDDPSVETLFFASSISLCINFLINYRESLYICCKFFIKSANDSANYMQSDWRFATIDTRWMRNRQWNRCEYGRLLVSCLTHV